MAKRKKGKSDFITNKRPLHRGNIIKKIDKNKEV